MTTDVLRTRRTRRLLVGVAVAMLSVSVSCLQAFGTIVRFETVMGNFDVRLFDGAMPRTVNNFLHYVTTSKYNSSVVHRNSDTQDTAGGPLRDFVIQGGGYYLHDPPPGSSFMTYTQVPTIAPIADEPGGGIAGPSNLRGTIAMAKSGPNTVTSQWFINQGNNSFLDSPFRSDGGFSAFGAVLGNGMTVVDAIGDLPLPGDYGFSIGAPFNDLPLRNFSGNSLSQVRVQHTVTVTRVRVLNLPGGDYDFNGTVNQTDYNIWKANFSSLTNPAPDGNGNTRVDAADYVLWRKTLGQTSSPGAAASVVPEPGSAIILALGAMLLAFHRRLFGRRG